MSSNPWREVRYGGAVIDEAEINAVVSVMKSGMAVGDQVRTFESRCAALLGHRYGVMVNSGSSALLLAMRLLDLPEGSEIITPVLTFGTDVSSIVHAGYIPVFVDVELETYQIDIDAIEQMIGPKTRALLVPSLLGNMPDWDRLREICDRHDLRLVEDSCDTLGSEFRGQPPGKRADITVTSFSIFHVITCLGNGGLVATNDPELWDRALVMRAWGRTSERFIHGTRRDHAADRFAADVDGIPYDGYFIFEDLGYGFIPNEAGAAFGHEQLNKLPRFFKMREAAFQRHQTFFTRLDDLFVTPRMLGDVKTTWLCYPIQLRPELGWSRGELQQALERAGIWTRVIFSGNITRHPMMRNVPFKASAAGYPVADQIMRHGLIVPCHPTMTDEDTAHVHATIQSFIDQRR